MGTDAKAEGLSRLLEETARAHHEAYPGEHEEWPEWYAGRMVASIEPFLGYRPTVTQLSEWLASADEEHRSKAPERPWPEWFAMRILSRAGEERAH